jgi:hypothetical protein
MHQQLNPTNNPQPPDHSRTTTFGFEHVLGDAGVGEVGLSSFLNMNMTGD